VEHEWRKAGDISRWSPGVNEGKSSDIKYLAVSHTHGDHVGNVELFPQAMLLVQKAEYEWPGPNNAPRFKPEHPVTARRAEGGARILRVSGRPQALA